MDITKLQDQLDPEDYATLKQHLTTLIAQTDAAKMELAEGRKGKQQEIERLQAWQGQALEALGISKPEELDAVPGMAARRADLARLASQEKSLQSKLATTTAERDQLHSDFQGMKKKQALGQAMAKYNFVDRDVVETFVAQRLEWSGEDLIYVSEDGVPSSLEDGLRSLALAKPNLLRNVEQGAGVMAGGGLGKLSERAAAIGRAFSKLLH